MKLSLKTLVVLVVAGLLGIFVYQAYWLTGLYRTMKHTAEQGIVNAMQTSDYNEVMLRIDRMREANRTAADTAARHGMVSVTASRDDDGDSLSVMVLQQQDNGTTKASAYVVSSNDSDIGATILPKQQADLMTLATYFQQGIHSGVDVLVDPDVQAYDSLLTELLAAKGLDFPHRLEYLHTWYEGDSTRAHVDTAAICTTQGYVPGHRARHYEYTFDIYARNRYRLTMEPFDLYVLRQMAGILATSLIILVILALAFWLLFRTIWRQKTLDEMKSDFTNNITHELKTPIAVAYAANDALLNFGGGDSKEKREKYLRISQEQLQRLSGLVEQILSISMERRRTFRLHLEALRPAELLPPLIEQHKLKADKPVEVTLHISPDDLTVNADRTHFTNILSNLIDNAIKYSVGTAVIDIDCRRTPSGSVRISVSDHGIGIAPDKLPHIFDRFYRVPTGNTHNVKGYGLGLFYVKTMVEQHGGNVRATSRPGQGSTFVIDFK